MDLQCSHPENIEDSDDSIMDSNKLKEVLLEVEIDLNNGYKNSIKILKGDNIKTIVNAFCTKHKLNKSIESKIEKEINNELNAILSSKSYSSADIEDDNEDFKYPNVNESFIITAVNPDYRCRRQSVPAAPFKVGRKIRTRS